MTSLVLHFLLHVDCVYFCLHSSPPPCPVISSSPPLSSPLLPTVSRAEHPASVLSRFRQPQSSLQRPPWKLAVVSARTSSRTSDNEEQVSEQHPHAERNSCYILDSTKGDDSLLCDDSRSCWIQKNLDLTFKTNTSVPTTITTRIYCWIK